MFKPIDPKDLVKQLEEQARKRKNKRKEMIERVEREWRELQSDKRR